MFKSLFEELSEETLAGLEFAGFYEPTCIQKEAIKPALEGKDLLASAKTGSGKTLAFLIPLLECLHKEKWSPEDGLGALVLTPTRELAYQIFEVLRLVGHKHNFSAALVIGGKDLAMERKRIDKMNIIICTPGRMQQHMEENPLFYGDNLKMLVIDEADRMLDMGFRDSLKFIVDFLPKERQCLLFSATQKASVEDLALLSLRDPVRIGIGSTSMPESLRQKYTVINLHEKLSFLFSFIKRHKKSKILVFIATCKQVRFMHDLFCRMKPGISVNALHGGLHQLKRMDIYNKFKDVRHCCLLATDIAARGLDFPDVDWVVQLDCPDGPKTYIHRVGRTARLSRTGRSLMVLMPNETDMIGRLNKKSIQLDEVSTRDRHLFQINSTVESHLARDVNLKEEAKRAFQSYIKSLLNPHFRHMFDIKKLDLRAYAHSLGLEIAPRVRILERRGLRGFVTEDLTQDDAKSHSINDNIQGGTSESEDQDDLLEPAKKPRLIPSDDEDENTESGAGLTQIEREILEKKHLSRAKLAKQLRKKGLHMNKRIVYNKE